MAFGLCKYKNALGEPNAGFRKYRIFNISIYDTAVVILFGVLISYFSGYNLWITLAVLFILGIIIHRLFCVRSTLDKLFFPNV